MTEEIVATFIALPALPDRAAEAPLSVVAFGTSLTASNPWPEALQAAFGDFLKRHAPGDVSGPTQQPGVISDSAPQPRAGL